MSAALELEDSSTDTSYALSKEEDKYWLSAALSKALEDTTTIRLSVALEILLLIRAKLSVNNAISETRGSYHYYPQDASK